jgi:parvulin-like peptidyl-prolyl isomerase
MSVLESMRSGTDSAAMQIIFAAVVVSFVFMGMGNYGDQNEIIVKVNGEGVNRIEYERAVSDRERRMSDSQTAALSADDLAALRERVLQDMIRRNALLQESVTLGIEVSDGEVAKVLLDIEFLKDSTGRFDMQTYELFLRRQGSSRSKFEEDIRDDIMLGKLEDLMRLGASVSEPLVKQTYVEENTKLDIEYIRVRPTSFLIAVDPSEEEIATWIGENGETLQADYDRDFAAKYDVPEMLELSMIRLGVQMEDGFSAADLKPKIDKIRSSIESGEDFEMLARKWSEDRSAVDGGNLGSVKVMSLD